MEDGKAVVDEIQAAKVRMIFKGYIAGLSLIAAAREAGLELKHPSVKHLLQNKRYMGDDFHPAIIDHKTFELVQEERCRRAMKISRESYGKEADETKLASRFSMHRPEKKLEDPFKQAEYIYSLIEVEK